MNEDLTLSKAGAEFIAQFEGCVLHPYNDPWNATIGIGHLIHYGQVTAEDNATWHGFTYARALSLFADDVHPFEAAIRAHIHVPLNQNQFDALVSLTYNTGVGVLDGTVGELINERRFSDATRAWQAWCHGSGGVVLAGLVRRREAEATLFLKPAQPRPAFVPYFPEDELSWEHEYDDLVEVGANMPQRQRLVQAMTARRKEIWKLAMSQNEGWRKANRLSRYNALRERSGGPAVPR
jgi:lysozyme